MNVNWANHIDDAGKIEPQQIIAYLEKHEWIDHTQSITSGWQIDRKIRIFQKIVDGGLYQVTVPMSRELADYNSAMLKAVVEIINSNEATEVRKLTAKIFAFNKTKEKVVNP